MILAFHHHEEDNDLLHVFLHVLDDSLKVLIITFLLFFFISFIEKFIKKILKNHKKLGPLAGASVGLVPQCGITILASELYMKSHITMGTLAAAFFACSDEALPILLSTDKRIYAIPLLLVKLIGGFILGFMIDLFIKKKEEQKEKINEHNGCGHEHKESFMHNHIIHPLIHTLKIFLYVLIANIVFGYIIHFIGGEEALANFISKHTLLAPIFSVLVGLIPNCVSSILLVELFSISGISFGAMLAGLCVNSGLGILYLFKNKKCIKDAIIITLILCLSSLLVGYILIFI